ncbi:MAG: putative transposase [Candidatus Sulfotelmatobacter sp.]
MGNGATRALDRVSAAIGQLASAPIQFEASGDVPRAGLLLAVPALLSMGLLRSSAERYALPPGYYGLNSILLLLAMMALARVKSIEQLRYVLPGEMGNLLGLDRVPEVRTWRSKLAILSQEKGRAARWNSELAQVWMGLGPEAEAMFYVDGHVRVYHGQAAQLPRHYVARQKLYLRATADYWINAFDGQPFFYINQEIDHGLVQALRNDVVPWLEKQVPIGAEHQRRMEADRQVPWFTVVFDREGYSPDLFVELERKRIAVLSYHRYPAEDWPVEEFQAQTLRLSNGETVRFRLAERDTRAPNGLQMREVRKLTGEGHQVALVSTNRSLPAGQLAVSLFARWAQENYFRYMRQHYALDRLVEFGSEAISETEVAVNPAWRILQNEVRKHHAALRNARAQLAGRSLSAPLSDPDVTRYELQQGHQRDHIEQLQRQLDHLKLQRKATPHHIPVKDLPEKDRFTRLPPERKHFIDTIKMISYRAETSMVAIVRERLSRTDDARALLRQIYDLEADLIPHPETSTLLVKLHHLTQAAHDAALQHLCDQLNETETVFPETDMRIRFQVGSS